MEGTIRKVFEATGPIHVRIRLPAGQASIRTDAAPQAEVSLEADDGAGEALLERTRVELVGDELVVDVPDRHLLSTPELDLNLRCPHGSWLTISVASADVDVRGNPGEVKVKSASGDTRIERASGDIGVQTASGDVHVGVCGGELDIGTASGDVTIDHATRGLEAHLVSGDLRVVRADGVMTLDTVSGDVILEDVGPGSLRGSSVSGDVRVSVRPGCDVRLDVRSLSGEASSELEERDGPGTDADRLLELVFSSVSGDIRVERAAVTHPV